MKTSESVAKLAEALAKAQGAMSAAKKDSDNPFFRSRYADLASVVEAIRKPLADNGLAYVQTTEIDDGDGVLVETILLHASGEWISGRLRMKPVKADPQGVGSCITYARRYGLQAIVGVPADDDDGNAASHETAKPQRPAQAVARRPIEQVGRPDVLGRAPVAQPELTAEEAIPMPDDPGERAKLIKGIKAHATALTLDAATRAQYSETYLGPGVILAKADLSSLTDLLSFLRIKAEERGVTVDATA